MVERREEELEEREELEQREELELERRVAEVELEEREEMELERREELLLQLHVVCRRRPSMRMLTLAFSSALSRQPRQLISARSQGRAT